MTRQEYAELLSLKEERVSMWEQYGCVLSKEGIIYVNSSIRRWEHEI